MYRRNNIDAPLLGEKTIHFSFGVSKVKKVLTFQPAVVMLGNRVCKMNTSTFNAVNTLVATALRWMLLCRRT